MPNLAGTPKRRKFGSSGAKGAPEEEAPETPKARGPAPGRAQPQRPPTQTKPIRNTLLEDDDDDEDDDDEIISASLEASKGSKIDPKIFAFIAVGAVVLVVMLFLMFGSKRQDPGPIDPGPTQTDPEPVTPPETFGDDSLGIQDFTQNTNMTSDSPLTNPDGFVEDLHGLTTRVDYEVASIQSNVIDFVNYTKKRGTWGGGMELYYLDCTYKENHYVIQVPFTYYKELDDEGIVPVRMEVLYVKEANGDTLSIVSYMCLDANTLQTVIKARK